MLLVVLLYLCWTNERKHYTVKCIGPAPIILYLLRETEDEEYQEKLQLWKSDFSSLSIRISQSYLVKWTITRLGAGMSLFLPQFGPCCIIGWRTWVVNRAWLRHTESIDKWSESLKASHHVTKAEIRLENCEVVPKSSSCPWQITSSKAPWTSTAYSACAFSM